MPVFFVNAAVTFRNAAFSLPPHSERTSIVPAFFAAGFALLADPAVAAVTATMAPSATASRTSQERRFNSISSSFRRLA